MRLSRSDYFLQMASPEKVLKKLHHLGVISYKVRQFIRNNYAPDCSHSALIIVRTISSVLSLTLLTLMKERSKSREGA
jgi:hypothetical protein